MALNDKLQSQLQDASRMSDTDIQKTGRAKATGVTGGVVRSSIAPHRVGGRREAVGGGSTPTRSADRTPLGVIENVEGFRAELKIGAFLHRKVLVQSHVEVPIAGVAQ